MSHPIQRDGYLKWRSLIPFTDEQIAQLHDEEAARRERDGNEWLANHHRYRAQRCRMGHVNVKDSILAAVCLTKVCALCPKPALYRYGWSGRCKDHRSVMTPHNVERIRRLEKKQEHFEGIEQDRSREALMLANKNPQAKTRRKRLK